MEGELKAFSFLRGRYFANKSIAIGVDLSPSLLQKTIELSSIGYFDRYEDSYWTLFSNKDQRTNIHPCLGHKYPAAYSI